MNAELQNVLARRQSTTDSAANDNAVNKYISVKAEEGSTVRRDREVGLSDGIKSNFKVTFFQHNARRKIVCGKTKKLKADSTEIIFFIIKWSLSFIGSLTEASNRCPYCAIGRLPGSIQ
jgi:hypothetical protein